MRDTKGSNYSFVPPEGAVDQILSAGDIGFDTETKDPELTDKGSGCYRKDGYMLGLSIGNKAGSLYLPVAHPDTPAEAKEQNRRIIQHVCESSNTKIGANIFYDLEWCAYEGFEVNGQLEEVQYAEPILNEYEYSYSLDKIADKRVGTQKYKDVIKEYCEMMNWSGDPRKHLWKMPSYVVDEYACQDAELPVDVFASQKIELERQGLMDVYRMECALMPFLLQMRKQGVRIDIPLLERTSMAVAERKFEAQERVYEWAGHELNIGSTAQLAKVMDRKGIAYPRNAPTERMKAAGKLGNPCLDADAIKEIAQEHPECAAILEFKHYNQLINTFMIPYMSLHVDGRLHCNFHPLRSDDYGTVSGRYSSSKPNLQQVSAQSEDDPEDDGSLLSGQIVRKLFIPEDGCDWGKLDYSQVEYRITAHYALGPGADELRASYNEDPDTDYHAKVQSLTGFDRRTTKRLNFGGAYGMGNATAAKKFGWTMEEASLFMEGYHKAAPYIKYTRKRVAQRAAQRGYIYTLLNRRARTHPSRKLHSMFNRLIQGSAADVMKMAMLKSYEKGLFDVLIPHLTVHDEVDVSIPRTKAAAEALAELNHTMETAVQLAVPLKVDCHTGRNWAEAD